MSTTVDAMTEGFVTAALWADCIWTEADQDPSGESGGREYLTPSDALTAAARELCDQFLTVADTDAYAFMEAFGDPDGGHPGEYLGHTFYLSAARHGVCFTDRAWRTDDPMSPVCARLHIVAHRFPEVEWLSVYDCGDGTADLG